MEITTQELIDLMDDACARGEALEQEREETRAIVRQNDELRVELHSAREERRILKRTADQAKSKADTLEKILGDRQDKLDRLENTFLNFSKHNKMLHDMLQEAGIEAPTFAQFLSTQAAQEDEEEGEE